MKLIDLHQDLLLHLNKQEFFKDTNQTSWEMLEEVGTKILVATAFPVTKNLDWFSEENNDLIASDFNEYITYCKESPHWQLITSAEEIDTVMRSENQRGIVMHIEGLNVFNGTDEHWAMLKRWHEMGWRSLGAVWNKSNALGGGTEETDKGLSELGREVIQWSLKKRMLVDCAHMHKKMFTDTVQLVKKANRPIYVSHGNTAALCPDPRNFDDTQLKEIADTDGTIGVFFSGAYVSKDPEKNTMDTVVAHIKHMVDIAGIDHVSIGSDLGGVTKGVPKGLESVLCLKKLDDELAAKNFSEGEREKVFYKNAERVLKAYL